MAIIGQVADATAAQTTRETWNDNDTAINAEVIAATAAIVALEGRFTKSTIDLVADVDYTDLTNPFTLPIVPNVVEVRAADGTKILGLYNNINQTTGDITLNSGSNYTGAIITIIGW